MFGVPAVEIDRTIRLALAGVVAVQYRDADGKEYSMNVRLPVEETSSRGTFDNIYVSSLSGAQIPLSQLALSRSNLYSPLAFVIIGGLITSTLLARLVTPVMYKLTPPELQK